MGTKISEFAAATTPLTGAELVPVVQGGSTLRTTAGAFSTLAPVQTVAGRTGAVTLGISDVASLQTTLDGKLSTSGGVISANSSTDALRITQTGAGNALVVEDSTNPDATPFVVTADGNVGAGTSAPTTNFTIAGTTTTSSCLNITYNSALESSNFNVLRFRGTSSAPSSILSGDKLGAYLFAGAISSSASINSASIEAYAAENYTTGATGSYLGLFTTSIGSAARVERMRITDAGNVGIGTSTPTYALDIQRSSGEAVIRVENTSATNGAWLVLKPGASSAAYINNATAATPTVFLTGGSELMRITSAGNVGIGTSAPDTKLHAVNTAAGSAVVGAFIQNADNTVGTETRLAFSANGASLAGNRYAWIGHVNTGGTNGGALTFATTVGGTPATERMRIDSSGNVGIGTSAPAAKLDVSGIVAFNSSGYAFLRLGVADSTGWAVTKESSDNSFNVFQGGVQGSPTANRLKIDTNGNFCIGGTSAGTTAQKVLVFANAVAPTTSPTGTGQLYVENGALKYRGSANTVTTIANA